MSRTAERKRQLIERIDHRRQTLVAEVGLVGATARPAMSAFAQSVEIGQATRSIVSVAASLAGARGGERRVVVTVGGLALVAVLAWPVVTRVLGERRPPEE